ncbi:M48 family metallopeptidase [Streptomyces sp. NPDC127038]|uniref:M48 family metallopeptidase n=1 Tax=Streptomyces sp. NPDC127038 TaxID=3347114 RepID=UPI00364D63D5
MRTGLATAAAYGIAALVHLVALSLLTVGLLLVVLRLRTIVQPLIGLVLLLTAAVLRPRPGGLDPDLPTLRREEAPALYALLDEVADTVGVRRVDAVQVGTDFTVRVRSYGVRRRRRLVLGYPLWMTFAPQQRVAAVAHELGHFAARDARRGALVGAALSGLTGAVRQLQHPTAAPDAVLAPSPLSRYAEEMTTAAVRFKAHGLTANWALWLPGLLMKGGVRSLLRLTLPNARRTEFRADAVAARVASTEAAVSALRDRRLAHVVDVEVHRLAIATRTFGWTGTAQGVDQDFWPKVAAHTASVSEGVSVSDGVRDERAAAGSDSEAVPGPDGRGGRAGDPGSGLPGIGARVARLSTGPAQQAAVLLDAARADAIEVELREPKRVLAAKVLQDCVQA